MNKDYRYDPRLNRPDFSTSDRTNVLAGWAAFLVVAIFVVFTVINGINGSSGGPSATDHPKPLPAHVVQLDPANYLVYSNTVGSSDLCWGDNGDQNPIAVYTDRSVPSIGATYIHCGANQSWDKHVPNSPSFAGAVANEYSQQPVYIGAGVLLLLGFSPAAISLLADRRRYNWQLGRYHATVEDVRREIRQGFAEGQIDKEQMLVAIDRIYGSGVEPPKDAALPKEIRALDSYGEETS